MLKFVIQLYVDRASLHLNLSEDVEVDAENTYSVEVDLKSNSSLHLN